MRTIAVGWILLVGLLACPLWAQDSDAGAAQSADRNPQRPGDARVLKEGWIDPPQRAARLPGVPPQINRAYVIPVHGVVDNGLVESVKRKLATARSAQAEFLVLEVDSPGGAMAPMLDIVNLLSDQAADIRTVAYVTTEAIGAAAVIALACDEIYMKSAARIGDAMPLTVAPDGGLEPLPKAQREKIDTYMRTKVRSLAEQNGYPPVLSEAMVGSDVEVWLTRNEQTGELRFLDPERDVPGITPSQDDRPERAPRQGGDWLLAPWQYIRNVAVKREALSMTASQAIEYGFAKGLASDRKSLGERFNVQGEMTLLQDADADVQAQVATRADLPDPPAGARVIEEGWFEPTQRDAPLPDVPEQVARAYVIPIHGGIDPNLYDSVKRKVFMARSAGAELIVLDMDTPGGRVDVMLDIAALLTDELKKVRTVAFVSREAISAGAFISLACDEIYMQPGTQIGDAMPVMPAPGGGYQPIPKAEREKAEAYLRAKMRSMAEQNGYSPELAEAMVSLHLEVWLIRDKQTGQLRFLNPAEKLPGNRGDDDDDRPRIPAPDQVVPEGWEFVSRVDRADQLLTMTASEALKWGFCKEILPSREALAERFNVQGEMTFLEDTTEEKIAAFLTNPAITSLLLLIGIGAVYAEFNTPGLGIAAAVALAAFTILIGSHFMLGLALWWEVMLFVAGIILIGVEIFVIPGFGVAGISGIALCAMSLLAMMIPNAPLEIPWPRTDLMWGYFRRGGVALTIGFLGSVALMVVLSRILPKSSLSNKLFLAPAAEYHEPPTTEQHPIHSIKAGDEGVAATTCRPSGQVRIGEHLLDAVADGTMIASGTKVRVLRNDGNRLVIEPTET